MLGKAARRIVDVVVVLFALYAFVFVPLGSKTALGHVKAIFTTDPAREAGQEAEGAAARLWRALRGGGSPGPSNALIHAEPAADPDPARADASVPH